MPQRLAKLLTELGRQPERARNHRALAPRQLLAELNRTGDRSQRLPAQPPRRGESPRRPPHLVLLVEMREHDGAMLAWKGD